VNKLTLVAALCLGGTPCALPAQLPPPVAAGLAAIKAGDYNRAIDEWTKTWEAGPGTDSARIRLKNGVGRLSDKPQTWDLVRDITITQAVHRYFFVIGGERDPLFLVLETYQRPDGTWTVEHIQYNSSLNGLPPMDAVQFLRPP
jgi:hypothetical protein